MLWLWCRPAAVAPIRPLAWELPCAVSAALKTKGKKKKIDYGHGTHSAKSIRYEIGEGGAKRKCKEMKY